MRRAIAKYWHALKGRGKYAVNVLTTPFQGVAPNDHFSAAGGGAVLFSSVVVAGGSAAGVLLPVPGTAVLALDVSPDDCGRVRGGIVAVFEGPLD